MFIKCGTKNNGRNISIGQHTQSQDAAEFGEFGYAGISIFDTLQISRRFYIAIGLDGVRTIGQDVGKSAKSR